MKRKLFFTLGACLILIVIILSSIYKSSISKKGILSLMATKQHTSIMT